MISLLIAAGAALVAGLVAGAMAGAWFADRKLRSRVAVVGAEVVRLRAIAEEKLSGDDPDLPTLLRNLNTATEQAFRAIEAMQAQAAITRRKSAGGKEVLEASREIVRMMEEMGAALPAVDAPPTARLAPAPAAQDREAPAREPAE